MYCERNGQAVNDFLCNNTQKPAISEACKLRFCGEWSAGSWRAVRKYNRKRKVLFLIICSPFILQCSSSCGNGITTRSVNCVINKTLIDHNECDLAAKPVDKQACNTKCPRSSWRIISTSDVSLLIFNFLKRIF